MREKQDKSFKKGTCDQLFLMKKIRQAGNEPWPQICASVKFNH